MNPVALWVKLPESSILFWIFVLLQSSFVRHLPNHYKMVINCGPNIQNMRERERERERLWVERWGKEIELEEVYEYGCLGKEIYCIPYQFHPFHSFPLVLFFPLFSPICVSVCLVNQQYYFFFPPIHWFHFWNFFSFSFALCSYSWIILCFSIFYDYFC